jgi:hypothetical protein
MGCVTSTVIIILFQVVRENRFVKQEYDYKGSSGNEKLPPRRFSTVGIVRKVPSPPTQLTHKHHHHGVVVPFAPPTS